MSEPPSLPPRSSASPPIENPVRPARDISKNAGQPPKSRRFAPQPVETSTKSSRDRRQRSPETGDLKKVRRVSPKPVETSTKSSRDRSGQEAKQEEKAKPRRFAPEPVETSTRSSRDNGTAQQAKPATRRFAPQPMETTHKSSRDRESRERPHITFSPEPPEINYASNRSSRSEAPSEAPEPAKPAPRRFAPVLIDQAKRSRRAGDGKSAIGFVDRTEQGHTIHAREHRRHITGYKTPKVELDKDGDEVMPDAEGEGHLDPSALEQSLERKRSISPMDGRPRPGSRTRTHSYHMPELDTIESSESERDSPKSSVASSPAQGSPITASDSSFNNEFKHATRIRESIDENFSHYLLQLEAKRAEARLREQALAAFPNSDFHEPVQHYVDEDKDTESDDSYDDRPATWEGHEDDIIEKLVRTRRESTKIPWEQLEMQRHAERMEQDRKADSTTTKQPSVSPWWTPAPYAAAAQPDNELRNMRDRARPPMLGDDITFPRCPSPEPARFDVTQGSAVLQNQLSQSEKTAAETAAENEEASGLWRGVNHADTSRNTHKPSTGSTTSANEKGLWGGFCLDTGETNTNTLAPPSMPTGLMTPFETSGNPFEISFAVPNGNTLGIPKTIKTPPTPTSALQIAQVDALNGILVTEAELDTTMARDYPDPFITQVYNYLSLGYPALARPFDEELSKIARIPIAELRQDDVKAKKQPRGYIRLGQDFEGGGGEVGEQTCMRWVALKRYVREWARQEKRMVHADGFGGNWGTGARRGSWAI